MNGCTQLMSLIHWSLLTLLYTHLPLTDLVQ